MWGFSLDVEYLPTGQHFGHFIWNGASFQPNLKLPQPYVRYNIKQRNSLQENLGASLSRDENQEAGLQVNLLSIPVK